MVGIAVDHRDEVLEFADRFKMTYPLLIGEQDALDAAAALGVDSPVFPFTVFTDRRGEVVALFVGELHRPQAELILAEVQKLNQGAVELPAARHAIAAGLQQLAPNRRLTHTQPSRRSRQVHRQFGQSCGPSQAALPGSLDVRRRSLPFHLQFLVIIADLCNATAPGLIAIWLEFCCSMVRT